MPTLCVIATALVLILTAVYFGYIKPLMADGRKKREEEAAKAKAQALQVTRDLEAQARRARDLDLRNAVMCLLNDLVSGNWQPERGVQYYDHVVGRRSDYPPAFEALQGLHRVRATVAEHSERINTQSTLSRQQKKQLIEIQKALQLGQPVES